jgi:hypothetical protein
MAREQQNTAMQPSSLSGQPNLKIHSVWDASARTPAYALFVSRAPLQVVLTSHTLKSSTLALKSSLLLDMVQSSGTESVDCPSISTYCTLDGSQAHPVQRMGSCANGRMLSSLHSALLDQILSPPVGGLS